ncbi:MAG: single-strand DNA-binding protein [Acidimicrobiaceae bacterium]|nr:single-strand DNA-binding protein [Acidimicrobiaceae bacterium]
MVASNLVLLQGTLSRASERRTLPSGDELVQYEVTTRDADGRADSVPVVWPAAPARAEFEAGVNVVVAGRVRRRYFRTGGVTGSRTEVVADGVVVAGSKAAARLVQRALRQAELPQT